jgi:ornithine cyclodeaminase/alanine dehydrogenase-like protein (mu-crystallin family)
MMTREDIHATLGEILAERKPGRTDSNEITLFDATGLAFQDLIAGHLAMKLAQENNLGQWVRIS